MTKDFYNRLINTINSFDDFENLSIEWIKSTLEHNDMNAETFLESIQNHQILFSSLIGFFYQHGIGCNVNKDKALEMYLLAIKQDKVQTINNTIAKYLLSLLYYKDIIIFHKEKIIFEWYLKSAETGDDTTQFNLGRCYQYEIGISKDDEKAFEWYLKSAKAGNNAAQNSIGHCYECGIGISKDEEKAFEWYLKSAETGNNIAQFNLGRCYQYEIEKKIQEAIVI